MGSRRRISRGQAARGTVAAAAVIAAASLLAACGSSGKSSGASASSQSAGIRFSDCMRAHGVPNFPDPGGGGGGFQIPAGSGIKPQAPAFQTAQSACQKLLGGGGPVGGGNSEARKLMLVKLAECMRRHGITTFPDPTSGAPSGPPPGGGIAFGAPGSFISVSMTMINSPGFKQAATACGFPGAHGRPAGATLAP